MNHQRKRKLDPDTNKLAHAVMAEARRNGKDTVEALYEAGLLLTPAMKQMIVFAELQSLLRIMEEWRPAEYLRRVNKTTAPTPKDMYDGILGYMADYVAKAANQ